jgi:hypothetical protein
MLLAHHRLMLQRCCLACASNMYVRTHGTSRTPLESPLGSPFGLIGVGLEPDFNNTNTNPKNKIYNPTPVKTQYIFIYVLVLGDKRHHYPQRFVTGVNTCIPLDSDLHSSYIACACSACLDSADSDRTSSYAPPVIVG